MKTAKRILSLCLALVLSFSFLLPCLAVEQVTPVIMVTGMNAVVNVHVTGVAFDK